MYALGRAMQLDPYGRPAVHIKPHLRSSGVHCCRFGWAKALRSTPLS